MSSLDVAGYRVLARLGQGGMARVFVACSERQPGFTKLLVLKILKEDLGSDTDILEMFVQEARIAARLNHANVVQTYEVGKTGDLPFIAMEYLEGQAFSAVTRRLGAAFPLALQARVLADALCGLHYAHELTDFDGTRLGIVHRDVSPQNIFLTYDGTVKILDFGIAKLAASPSMTRAGVMKGKVGYMAPEQVTNRNVDRRADVFAVGVMLWEAIAGRRLVEPGVNEVAALQARLSGTIPRLRELAPEAPEELVAIAENALSLEPEARYATAEEMQNDLEEQLRASSSPQGRDLGKLLRETYQEERAKLKKTIEEQLAQPGASVPIVPTLGGPGSFSPVSGSSGTASRSTSGDTSVDVTLTALTPPPAVARRARRRLVLVLVAGAAALAALAITAVLSRRSRPEPTATQTTASASAPSAAPVAPSASARSVSLVLVVQPRDTRATLDGADVPLGEPIVRPLDEVTRHELVLTAPGHKPMTRELVFDRDQSVAADLTPVAPAVASGTRAPGARPGSAPKPGAASGPAVTATAAPPADSGFGEVQKRKPRPIDTSSPF